MCKEVVNLANCHGATSFRLGCERTNEVTHVHHDY